MSYLHACIYDALRLSPGLPSVSPRVAGPGGMTLDGSWFPEGTEIGVPFWSLCRQKEVFEEPLLYKPERWAPAAEGGEGLQPGVGPAAAFTPFGQGRFGCLGRHMATQKIALLLARLIWLLEMRQEPGKYLGGGQGVAKDPRGVSALMSFSCWTDLLAMETVRLCKSDPERFQGAGLYSACGFVRLWSEIDA